VADQVQAGRPRVALSFGDAAAVKHLRDAVAGQVDLVYDAQAADFDAAKLVDSHARAALVNLDSFEWLDTIGAQLSKAGVAVVFNDPEISHQLDGWERARWLRHLVAKLRGSDDYDPPRPLSEPAALVADAQQPEPEARAAVMQAQPAPEVVAAPRIEQPAVTERPLSAREIDTLTVDFVAAPVVAATVADVRDQPALVTPTAEPAAGTDSIGADADASVLDVDTEALSAMIDARLAESEQHVDVTTDAWQVAAEATVTPASLAGSTPAPEVPAAEVAPAAAAPVAAPPDDSDVLAGLPALGDWELLDPDLPVAPVASVKRAESSAPAIPDDLSGLELVPMDNDAPIDLHTEPIEHRLYVEARKQATADHKATDSNGDHA
jgi:two-component system chemotaxis response regulator CheB/chemosensory pili system protein ChpB (putative protein-glutamate methylesterase)